MTANHSATAQSSNGIEKAQLLLALQDMNEDLDDLLAIKSSLDSAYLAARQIKLDQLVSFLNTITPDSIYEYNLKMVLTVLTEALVNNTGSVYTAAQINLLKSVAQQCRYSGGIAVVIARGEITQTDFPIDDDLLCTGGTGPRSADGQSVMRPTLHENEILLNPNPAGGHLQIILPKHFNMGNIQIFNAFGQVVLSETFSENTETLNIDLTGFPTGVYYVKAYLDGDSIAAKKLIKRIH